MMVSGDLSITTSKVSVLLPAGKWPDQGSWTAGDWERLPDDGNRYEVIDGVLYVTSAPSLLHQLTGGNLYHLLRNHLDAQSPPPGIFLLAPAGVILPTGPVIPDLVYVHRRNHRILTTKRIVGVPDLVVEIASPGTAAYDRREKQDAFARSGVAEYWWVDPGHRTVEVLVLDTPGRYRPLALVESRATIPSVQLPGLQFPVEDIFPTPELLGQLRSEGE